VAETAAGRRSGATSCAAITTAKPKTAPCGSAVTVRAANNHPKLGASAEAQLPATNSAMSASISCRRGSRVPSAIISGAPITTPIA